MVQVGGLESLSSARGRRRLNLYERLNFFFFLYGRLDALSRERMQAFPARHQPRYRRHPSGAGVLTIEAEVRISVGERWEREPFLCRLMLEEPLAARCESPLCSVGPSAAGSATLFARVTCGSKVVETAAEVDAQCTDTCAELRLGWRRQGHPPALESLAPFGEPRLLALA